MILKKMSLSFTCLITLMTGNIETITAWDNATHVYTNVDNYTVNPNNPNSLCCIRDAIMI